MMEQPGIFALGSRAHQHLYFSVNDQSMLKAALGSVFELVTSVRGVNVVVGLRPTLARQLDATSVAAELDDFATMSANGISIPAEQHDLWVWVHGPSPDVCFDATSEVLVALQPHATLDREQSAFTYRDSRDLSGFEDGTENPPLHEAASLLTNTGFPLATVALVQIWDHDLTTVKQLDPDQYETLIGRTLNDSIELDPPQLTDRSHISRVVIEDEDGEELEIFRRSTPFGNQEEHGLVFVGFAPDYQRMLVMLENMIGADDAIVDHVTDFSTCAGSGWYVVLPVESLQGSEGGTSG